MIETIMYFGIGFLCASLLGLVIVPLVHNRATRLTVRRLEAATPLSIAETQADKDQLRAEFAMSMRRLELTIEQLKAASTGQLSELGKKAEAIAILKSELGEKTAAILALQAREKALDEQLRNTEQDRAAKAAALHEAELALADKVAALAKATAGLDERTLTADAQRVEITALRTQVDALQVQLDRFENDVKDTADRLARPRSDADAASKKLADAHGNVEGLGDRAAQLGRQLVAPTSEAEILTRRAQDLEALLAEREHAINQLTSELEAARKAQADLRGGRDAEAASASERAENAMLRERINDIAAEVARLTMALEGPGSPIETILASEAPAGGGVNGGGAGHGKGEPARGNLADRIRALQSKASRLSPVS